MDALLMCGGRGTRLDADCEKPLFEVGGEPMVARVADALAESRVETAYAVVSPHTPETEAYVANCENEESVADGDAAPSGVSLPTIETPGEGYVADLQAALAEVEPPVLTVAADLPLLAGDAVNSVLDAYDARYAGGGLSDRDGHDAGGGHDLGDGRDTGETGSLTVCVPAELKRALGASTDATFERDDRELAPSGVNVVANSENETMYETYDARFAVNVNRRSDADLAEGLL